MLGLNTWRLVGRYVRFSVLVFHLGSVRFRLMTPSIASFGMQDSEVKVSLEVPELGARPAWINGRNHALSPGVPIVEGRAEPIS